MTLITVQVCLLLFVGFFEVASVISRWERKLLLPGICRASAVTEAVCPALGCSSPQLSQLREGELEGAITAQTLPLSYPLRVWRADGVQRLYCKDA